MFSLEPAEADMKKFLGPLLALMMLTACHGPYLVTYNGCAGTWVRVRDGDGRVLADSIPYGFEQTLDLETYVGNHIELIAIGYKFRDGSPAGQAKTGFTIQSSYGSITAPQLEPWSIMGLWTSDGSGCRTR